MHLPGEGVKYGKTVQQVTQSNMAVLMRKVLANYRSAIPSRFPAQYHFSLLWDSFSVPFLIPFFTQGNEYIRTHRVVTLGGPHEEMHVDMKSREEFQRMINLERSSKSMG